MSGQTMTRGAAVSTAAEDLPMSRCPCHGTPVPGTARGWHQRLGPAPVFAARHELEPSVLPGRADHPYLLRLPDGRWCYIAEPYELGDDALADLVHLATAGFDISITAWQARHNPGHTVAVHIISPRDRWDPDAPD